MDFLLFSVLLHFWTVRQFSNQTVPEIKAQEFQVWKLEKEGSAATITVGDGNKNTVKEFKIPYTDFPLEEFTLWMEGNCLILPSEH